MSYLVPIIRHHNHQLMLRLIKQNQIEQAEPHEPQ